MAPFATTSREAETALPPARALPRRDARLRPRGRSHEPSVLLDRASLPERLTRLRGGTYSHTVGRATFSDGERELVDLISLNPNVDAYSLEPQGISPNHAAHYRPRAWGSAPSAAIRAVEHEIIWILTRSYPTIDVATLSETLRHCGYDIGAADIPEHEAIAATQAAIWHFTDGRHLLEETDANAVQLTSIGRNASLTVDPLSLTGQSWHAVIEPASPARLQVRIIEHSAIDAFAFDLATQPAASLKLSLQRSADGLAWQDIPSSAVLPAEQGRWRDGRFQVIKGLGVGATVANGRGARTSGYPHYRLVAESAQPTEIALSALRFRPVGQTGDGNSMRVVQLYRYLVAGARHHGASNGRAVSLRARAGEAASPELIGPFTTDEQAIGAFRVSARDARGRQIAALDKTGRQIAGDVPGGTAFYLGTSPAEAGQVQLDLRIRHGLRFSGTVLLGTDPSSARPLTTLGLVTTRRVQNETVRVTIPASDRSTGRSHRG